MNDIINGLLEQVPASTGSAALEALDQETRDILEQFATWLVEADSKTQATARAYKSYVATAILGMQDGKSWTDFSTDVRSGVKAFQRFTAKVVAEAADEVLDEAIELAHEDETEV